MYKHILVSLDGSELSERALPTAVALARAAGGRLSLVRIAEYEQVLAPAETPLDTYHLEMSTIHSLPRARAYLTNVAARYPDIYAEVYATEGDIATEILDFATDQRVDCIIMATHGYSGLRRLALGSVAERVAQHATCPVMILRNERPLNHLLVTLDGSKLAETAIKPALELARLRHARVTFLSVDENTQFVQMEPLTDTLSSESQQLMQQFAQQQYAETDTYLQQIVQRYSDHDLHIEAVVLRGTKPAQDILEAAERYGVDLVVMATHGETGLRRWLFGSVTERVLRHTSLSTMIVRPPASAFDSE